MHYLGLLFFFGDVEIAEADNQVPKKVAPKKHLWWSICIIWGYFFWRCGDSWSWQPSPKKSSPKKASLVIDMHYLGLLFWRCGDSWSWQPSPKKKVAPKKHLWWSICTIWGYFFWRCGDSWSWQPSPKKSIPKKASLVIDMHYLGLLFLEMWR